MAAVATVARRYQNLGKSKVLHCFWYRKVAVCDGTITVGSKLLGKMGCARPDVGRKKSWSPLIAPSPSRYEQ